MRVSLIALCAGLLLLAGCATHTRTTTPQAGLAAQAIVEAVLAEHGVADARTYQADDDQGVLFEAASQASRDAMRQWSARQGGDYVVSGVVHEWRYKTGVDGEPAVGVMIEIRDAAGKLIYSGTGARAGQRVIDDLLAPVVD